MDRVFQHFDHEDVRIAREVDGEEPVGVDRRDADSDEVGFGEVIDILGIREGRARLCSIGEYLPIRSTRHGKVVAALTRRGQSAAIRFSNDPRRGHSRRHVPECVLLGRRAPHDTIAAAARAEHEERARDGSNEYLGVEDDEGGVV